MRIEGSTLWLDASDHEHSVLTSLTLPDGSASGGLLVPEGDDLVFVLFADEELGVGDTVVASEQRFTIASVRHAHRLEQPVTALVIRRPEADDPVA